ncbi:hypothetical protein A3D77_00725 [Candidatus Gottesmanbacteria bacterium RIFCSPHIGHO2_02_FULL_39_11]|uniref:Uncharacterized protein n=1 Tax=Candidatus Gottesmanbacteria bacterium RIFCSPHIGHO2_02_FULL_39_11 TaxID=1798382 RepID=A0A1F5ZL82_9BACT|nr:MAG: hypothetical protein A3D77_00725 [Candidatus Gottesmanbacteria bacterium RIFCSPHIGHO2_02_FULL_39_11]
MIDTRELLDPLNTGWMAGNLARDSYSDKALALSKKGREEAQKLMEQRAKETTTLLIDKDTSSPVQVQKVVETLHQIEQTQPTTATPKIVFQG